MAAAIPLWMPDVRIQKMQYKKPQQTMKEIFGVILHTTEAPKGEQTIDRFVRDWNAAQAQSAHFIIDRTGAVGQCRALTDVAWHMNKFSINYIGVELIASQQHKESQYHGITRPQMDSIATLIGDLAYYFKFPIKKIERTSKTAVPSSDKDRGVGIHADFESTWCGRGSYWSGNKPDVRSKEFNTIIDDAAFYAQFGYF